MYLKGQSSEMLGQVVHLPLLGHAPLGDADALEALKDIVLQCVQDDRPIVVKPRHGANSALVFAWSNPREAM